MLNWKVILYIKQFQLYIKQVCFNWTFQENFTPCLDDGICWKYFYVWEIITFDLNCKNKETPTHLTSSNNHNTHSFLFVCSYLIISHIIEQKQLCDVWLDKD